MPAELRHWRAFVAAAETQHFGAAAERLGISQSALSQLIQALEASLGTQLFDRTGRRARLTEPGRVVLPEARAALSQAVRAERIGAALGRQNARTLAAGYVGSAVFHQSFSTLIGAIGAAKPSISLRLDQCSATNQVRYLSEQSLDIGIVRSPLPNLDPSLARMTLAREHMVVALPAAHPKAAKSRCSLGLFADEPLIQYIEQPSGGLRALATNACRMAGFEPKIAQTVPQIATMLCLVGAGAGIAIVPQTMSRLGVPGIVYRAISEPVVTELTLLYRRSDTAPAMRALIRLARRLIDKSSLSKPAF